MFRMIPSDPTFSLSLPLHISVYPQTILKCLHLHLCMRYALLAVIIVRDGPRTCRNKKKVALDGIVGNLIDYVHNDCRTPSANKLRWLRTGSCEHGDEQPCSLKLRRLID
jgi:hypothetical protein